MLEAGQCNLHALLQQQGNLLSKNLSIGGGKLSDIIKSYQLPGSSYRSPPSGSLRRAWPSPPCEPRAWAAPLRQFFVEHVTTRFENNTSCLWMCPFLTGPSKEIKKTKTKRQQQLVFLLAVSLLRPQKKGCPQKRHPYGKPPEKGSSRGSSLLKASYSFLQLVQRSWSGGG